MVADTAGSARVARVATMPRAHTEATLVVTPRVGMRVAAGTSVGTAAVVTLGPADMPAVAAATKFSQAFGNRWESLACGDELSGVSAA
jgi:hypothetical protein